MRPAEETLSRSRRPFSLPIFEYHGFQATGSGLSLYHGSVWNMKPTKRYTFSAVMDGKKSEY